MVLAFGKTSARWRLLSPQEDDAAFHVKAASDFFNGLVDHAGFHPAGNDNDLIHEKSPFVYVCF